MIEFLKGGKTLNDIHMGMSMDNVYDVLGEPDKVVGNKEGGYIYYKEYRYGYDVSGNISEMSIEFAYLEGIYEFKDLRSERYGDVIFESFSIGTKTEIHKFIGFLNYLKLEWKANSDMDRDYLILKLRPGPFVLFDLQDGTPFRISIMKGCQDM